EAGVDLVNTDLEREVRRLAADSTPEQTLRRMDAVGVARERLEANVAPLLAAEAMMVALRPQAGSPAVHRAGGLCGCRGGCEVAWPGAPRRAGRVTRCRRRGGRRPDRLLVPDADGSCRAHRRRGGQERSCGTGILLGRARARSRTGRAGGVLRSAARLAGVRTS